MIYNIRLGIEVADIFDGIDVDELKSLLEDEEELKNLKYALTKFKEAYYESLENDDYSLTLEEQEQSYNFHADRIH